jgi:hypothetical protein
VRPALAHVGVGTLATCVSVGTTGAAEVGCPRTRTGPLASPRVARERKPWRGAAA